MENSTLTIIRSEVNTTLRCGWIFIQVVKKHLLPRTHIEPIKDPGFDFFIHSRHDRDTDEDKDDSERALKPPRFTRKSSKTGNYGSTSDHYESKHDRKSECVDKSIDDSSKYWNRKYGREEKGIRRWAGREYWPECRTGRDGSHKWISDVLRLIEWGIWLTKSEPTTDPCPCMREEVGEPEGDEDTARKSLPKWWRDINQCRRSFEKHGEEDHRDGEWERHDVGIPFLFLGEWSREDHREYGEHAGGEDREHPSEEGGNEEGRIHSELLKNVSVIARNEAIQPSNRKNIYFSFSQLLRRVYSIKIKDRWSIWKKWLKYRGKWR